MFWGLVNRQMSVRAERGAIRALDLADLIFPKGLAIYEERTNQGNFA